MPHVYKSTDCGNNRKYVFRPLYNKTLKFRVKTNANVNLCLTPTASETPHKQYEIFLGAWCGMESAIRKHKKDDVHKVQTPDILSNNQFRGFWVVVTDHAIKVGKEGQATPFLIHNDAVVKINVSYYGYCTSYGSTGQWTFGDDDVGPGIDMADFANPISQVGFPPGAAAVNPHPAGIYPQPICGAYATADTKSMKWVQCKSVSMCSAPVKAGPGANSPYVALAYHEGGLIPGGLKPPNICTIPWGGKAFTKTDFILLSNPGNVEIVWEAATMGIVPTGALQGGHSETGEPLYIGRYRSGGTYLCGKVHPSHRKCYVPCNGREDAYSSYEVLCLKTIPSSFLDFSFQGT